MPFYNNGPVKTNPAVDKLHHLAKLAHQGGNAEAGKALDFAAELVAKRLAGATAVKALRDELAMAALPGLLTQKPNHGCDELASRAYQLADAMLEAREL